MAQAVYEFKVDSKRDGTYGATIDDLTSRLIGQAVWNTGMTTAYQDFAPPARLTVQIDNRDGAFNPDTIGATVISNGDFATWSGGNPSSWTVTGEVSTNPEVSQVGQSALHGGTGTGACNLYSTSSSVSISQVVLTAGTTYKVTFDITATAGSTGYIGVYDNATLISPRYHYTGTYTLYFNATSTTFKIMSSGACDMTIDNVAVYPVSTYGYLLTEGTLGRLRATFNATTYTLYVGRLDSFTPTPGSNSRRVVTLQFTDMMFDLLDTEYIPALQTSVTTDAPLTTLFESTIAPFPYSSSHWLLGVQGSSELDLTTALYTPPTYSFDTGNTTYDYIGDNIRDGSGGTNAQAFIREVIAGEVYARFFYDPKLPGYAFHSRHHDALNTTVAFTVTENDYEPDSSVFMRENVLNRSRVTYQPRKVGSAGGVVWSSDTWVGVDANPEPIIITARYRDPAVPSARCGATDLIPLLPGTDYVALRSPDLIDVSDDMSISYQGGANSAVITINPRSYAFTLTVLQIRGTLLTTYDARTAEANNGDSQRRYKLSSETLDIGSLSDGNFAQSLAYYKVNKFSDAISTFQSINWIANKTDSRMANALSMSVGDRITVSDGWLSHSADYIVVGYRHTVTWGGDHTHDTTAVLKPYFREKSWILDSSALNSTTIVGL